MVSGTTARGRAIMGWSMGGYGALLAAERRPEPVLRRGRRQRAIWPTPGETVAGAFDNP